MFDADSDDDDCRLMEVWRQQEELRGVAVEKASAEDDAASRMVKAPIDFIMVDLRSLHGMLLAKHCSDSPLSEIWRDGKKNYYLLHLVNG